MLFARPSLTMRALRAAQAPRYVRAFGTSIPVRSEDLSTPEAKQNRIISILTEKFTPEDLQVQDISGGCGSFFAIMLKSPAFTGKSTIQAHRMVNKEIKDVISDIHGLQLKTVASEK
ncbi:uncharacterized protein MJAP1_000756 [Malassezia japonica]|uniref:Bola-like protein n=1 Tax=Malassezia japonica TaxID=223818 RepID=A0AAF0EZ04_9BASI|nr:uncharacterized protein MJAP1_000756 [Malassezia japonica]WFD37809.1 hypothetical protein MJAP1_000756 [Malassezia japonica]